MHRQNGLTLIELIIAMAILSIVMAAVTKLFISTNHVYHRNQAVLDMQQQVRNTKMFVVNDLRMAGYDPTGNAVNATVEQANSTAVHVLADLDADNNCSSRDEDVSYRLVGDKFKRNGGVLIDNVKTLDFSYKLEDGSVVNSKVSDPGDIRKINFSICGELGDDFSGRNFSYCLEDSVTCRNMYLQ